MKFKKKCIRIQLLQTKKMYFGGAYPSPAVPPAGQILHLKFHKFSRVTLDLIDGLVGRPNPSHLLSNILPQCPNTFFKFTLIANLSFCKNNNVQTKKWTFCTFLHVYLNLHSLSDDMLFGVSPQW